MGRRGDSPGVARGRLSKLFQAGCGGQAHAGLGGDGVAVLVRKQDDGDAVCRQGIGDVLVLSGGGAGDELGELGVGRILQDQALVRGCRAQIRAPTGRGLQAGVGQGAAGSAARLGVDRTGQDITDLGAGSAPDGGLEALGGGGELEDATRRGRALELLGDDGNLLGRGAQRHDLRVAAAVGLERPGGTDHYRGEQDEAGGDGEGHRDPP